MHRMDGDIRPIFPDSCWSQQNASPDIYHRVLLESHSRGQSLCYCTLCSLCEACRHRTVDYKTMRLKMIQSGYWQHIVGLGAAELNFQEIYDVQSSASLFLS